LSLTWVSIWVDKLASGIFAVEILRPHAFDIAIIYWSLRQWSLLIQHQITSSFLFFLRVENPSILHFMLRIYSQLHDLPLILTNWFHLPSHLHLLLLLRYPLPMRVFPIILMSIHLHEVVMNTFLN
jgi:hypothetical protein